LVGIGTFYFGPTLVNGVLVHYFLMFAVWAYSGFLAKQEVAAHRQTLVDQYIAAFRHVESSATNDAKIALKALSTDISARVVSEQRGALLTLVDSQLAKLS
jgi:hypothetical protein